MRTLPTTTKPAAASPAEGEALPVVSAPAAVASAPTADKADKAGVTGGAPGVLPEVRNIPQPGVPQVSAARAPREVGEGAVPPVRSFRVVNGGYVVYDGARFIMAPGKVVTDAQYDMDLLRRQGMILEELRS